MIKITTIYGGVNTGVFLDGLSPKDSDYGDSVLWYVVEQPPMIRGRFPGISGWHICNNMRVYE